MLKYELIPAQLLHEGTITPENLQTPALCPDGIVLKTHTQTYLQKLYDQTLSASEQRRIGFPQSPELIHREIRIAQGTLDCCAAAQTAGVALNVAGGTHHAYADHGEGFCLLNDFAIAANEWVSTGRARQVLIIDLDVHQGNGTAKIFEQEPRVFTFSMHGAHNYPFRKETSDLDIPLEKGTGGKAYLELLETHLTRLLKEVRPDLALYLAGVDVLGTDRYGHLDLSIEACAERDRLVFRKLHAAAIPCAVSMGGGYSPDIRMIVTAHCNTYRIAKDVYGLE
jgi:acetoin utilization deacetylase AcuC-like enzyme